MSCSARTTLSLCATRQPWGVNSNGGGIWITSKHFSSKNSIHNCCHQRESIKFHYRQRLVQNFLKKKHLPDWKRTLQEVEDAPGSFMELHADWMCCWYKCDESQTFCKRLRSIWQEDPWGKASKRSRSTWPVSLFLTDKVSNVGWGSRTCKAFGKTYLWHNRPQWFWLQCLYLEHLRAEGSKLSEFGRSVASAPAFCKLLARVRDITWLVRCRVKFCIE